MAILSSDGKSVTVEWGDCPWSIAEEFLGNGWKYKELCAINNIPSPYAIYVDQVLKLTKDGSSTSTKTTNSNKPNITQFGLLSNVENTLFATWTWDKDHTESYKVVWTYDTGNGIWIVGNNSTNSIDKEDPALSKQSTYSIPSGARKIQFKVKPISEKKTTNGNETNYWTAEWSTVQTHTIGTPLAAPNVPTVEIEKYKLIVTLENIKDNVDAIEFEVVKDNSSDSYKTAKTTVRRNDARYTCYVDAGGKYKVRCRAIKGSEYSDWTDYSNSVTTVPATPSGITTLRATSENSVYAEWTAESTATSYDLEYTTKKEYFDGSDQTTTKTGIEFTHFEISGLEPGTEYFFRVRAVNKEVSGDNWSAWSESKSVVVGKDPAAPTTWSSTTTAITGEPLNLYWIHNSEDGSYQRYADLEIYVNGVLETYTFSDKTVDNSTLTYTPLSKEDLEDGKTHSCSIKTSKYVEGTTIKWRVRTAGITKAYGDWSVQRTIDVYQSPTLSLSITDADANSISVITAFPFYIVGVPGPKTQAPIGYHLSIKSNEVYETTDNMGIDRTVNAGEEVYSEYFDTFETMRVIFSASNIDLENNVSYTATCTVSMNSGLTAESSLEFSVAWTDMEYEPNAEISIDEDTLTAYIQPYCRDTKRVCYSVNYNSGKYTKGEVFTGNIYTEKIRECYQVTLVDNKYVVSATKIEVPVYGEKEPGLATTTGEAVYHGIRTDTNEWLYFCYVYPDETPMTETGEEVLYGMTSDGTEMYHCYVEETALNSDVTLSVYRREFDGSLTEIATEIDGAKTTTVTDPHPALDYARYRIIAVSKTTGSVSYYDLPGYPVGGKAAIIQWDEAWTSFETNTEDVLEQPPWSGSLLKLPYNIDVSEDTSPDVQLVEYIGRDHPIGYYGTQLGHNAKWSMEIEKNDKETIYALRRLQRWMDDVYVREPSGTGYWANIKVSFSQKHCEMTIPVSLSITRVEGGV